MDEGLDDGGASSLGNPNLMIDEEDMPYDGRQLPSVLLSPAKTTRVFASTSMIPDDAPDSEDPPADHPGSKEVDEPRHALLNDKIDEPELATRVGPDFQADVSEYVGAWDEAAADADAATAGGIAAHDLGAHGEPELVWAPGSEGVIRDLAREPPRAEIERYEELRRRQLKPCGIPGCLLHDKHPGPHIFREPTGKRGSKAPWRGSPRSAIPHPSHFAAQHPKGVRVAAGLEDVSATESEQTSEFETEDEVPAPGKRLNADRAAAKEARLLARGASGHKRARQTLNYRAFGGIMPRGAMVDAGGTTMAYAAAKAAKGDLSDVNNVGLARRSRAERAEYEEGLGSRYERVPVRNTETGYVLQGKRAPMRLNLVHYLERYPMYEPYEAEAESLGGGRGGRGRGRGRGAGGGRGRGRWAKRNAFAAATSESEGEEEGEEERLDVGFEDPELQADADAGAAERGSDNDPSASLVPLPAPTDPPTSPGASASAAANENGGAGAGAMRTTLASRAARLSSPGISSQRLRNVRGKRPGEVERLTRASLEHLGHPMRYMERSMDSLDAAEAGKQRVPFQFGEAVVHLQVLQQAVAERTAAAAKLAFLQGASALTVSLQEDTSWAGQLLIGMEGQLKKKQLLLQAEEAAKPSVAQLVEMCTAVEEGRGGRNVLWELLDECSEKWLPRQLLERVHQTRLEWARDINDLVPQLPPAQELATQHAALVAEAEEVNGRLQTLKMLEHALGKLRWNELQRERVHASGRLVVLLRLKRPLKAARRRAAENEGGLEIVQRLRQRSLVPPTRVTLKCAYTAPGSRRGTGKGPGRAALYSDFAAQLRNDLGAYLDFEPERLVIENEDLAAAFAQKLAEQTPGLGEQSCFVTYLVVESTDERIGGPRELIQAIMTATAASDFRMACVSEALSVSPGLLAAELYSREVPTVADMNVRRLLNEALVPHKTELRRCEKAYEPVLAEQKRRLRLGTPHGARADAADADMQQDIPTISESVTAPSVSMSASALTAGSAVEVKTAYFRAMGRERVLRELDRACPRGSENVREARLWLPRALDAAEARLSAELEGPQRLIRRAGPSYAKRRGVKRALARTHQSLNSLKKTLPSYVRAGLTVLVHKKPREQHGWVSTTQFLAHKRLALTLTRAAVASADKALLHALGREDKAGGRSQWGAAMQMTCAPPPAEVVSPAQLRACAEQIGIDMSSTSKELYLLWIAVEALGAPMPVFWQILRGEAAVAARTKHRSSSTLATGA
eukprot:CAMPEP_0179984182 /NCGR_PEP_ID=MMETSP0984-20121128/994_1 /TAXON_ID=483367 /ORGANISM="non described non described, Strain CCMP 2436" /LENGTH=1252 /DNA_ID=CAMNT_0021902747 /DNA_START=23 /DNA_END=3777 /DNA_ORIENTATION=+